MASSEGAAIGNGQGLMLHLAPYLVAGALALSGGAYFFGRHHGAEAVRAELQERLIEAQRRAIRNAELASRIEADRLTLTRELAEAAAQLEEMANDDPDASRLAIGADSVSRLNQR